MPPQRKSSQHVRVFIRTRPTARPYAGFRIQAVDDGQTLTVALPKDETAPINNALESLTFKFDGVLQNVSQDLVYDSCVADAVDSALAGYNATVLAYGQTGAGKTFTMAGEPRAGFGQRGVIPRALAHVFREVDRRTDRFYRLSVSYLEIYNEALRDLLADDGGAGADLAILDDAASTLVRGLTRVPVASEEEALGQFFLGEAQRSTAPHALNAGSSRSHCLFCLHVEASHSGEAAERLLVSKLNLVDLAGSERIKKTQQAGGDGETDWSQLREAACINKSLTFLEQVVNALARGDAHVPFRQSKLTAALRDALGGNSHTVLIAALWPEAAHLEECVSTLRFAARVRCLQTQPGVNESADPLLALRKAERQIRELRQELAMRDMLSGRGRVVYDDLTEGEQQELQQLATRYLSGGAELDELPIDSLKRIRETYKALKAVSAGWAATAAAQVARASQHSAGGQGGAAEPDAAGVGDVDAAGNRGFAIGCAPVHARPPVSPRMHTAAGAAAAGGPRSPRGGASSSSRSSPPRGGRPGSTGDAQQQQQKQPAGASWPPQLDQQPQGASGMAAGSAGALGGSSQPAAAAAAAAAAADTAAGLDRNQLFSKYKHAVPRGTQQTEAVKQATAALAQLKQALKETGADVNAAKGDIDALSEQLEAKWQQAAAAAAAPEGGSSSGEVLDGEQYLLIQDLKAAKARYRELFEGLQELRGAADTATDALAAAKEALLAGFDAWLATTLATDGQQQGGGQIGAWRGGGSAWEAADELEPGEAFERSQLAAHAAAEPGAVAYFRASKAAAAAMRARCCA